MSDRNGRTGRDARREGGFSLLEVMIAATILFSIIAIAGRFIASSTSLLGTVVSRSDADQSAAGVADKIARMFRNASYASLKTYYSAAPGSFTDGSNQTSIYLRDVKDNSGVPVYGDGWYLFPAVDEVNYTDNIDNDKDSRTDEVCLKMCVIPANLHVSQTDPTAGAAFNSTWYNKQTKLSDIRWYNTLPQYPPAPQAAQPGCQFIINGRVLTIRVVTLKWDPAQKKQINCMAEASVKLRN